MYLNTIILYQPSELSPTDMPCFMINFPQGYQGGFGQAEENISDSKNNVYKIRWHLGKGSKTPGTESFRGGGGVPPFPLTFFH